MTYRFNMRSAARRAAAATVLASAACSGFLEAPNPAVIDAGEVDPVADAPTLSNSAQQSYAVSLGWLVMYGGWFTGEIDVAETFPTRNEFGRRAVAVANGSHTTDVWGPLSAAAAGNHYVLTLPLPTPETNINLVRSHTWLGYSFLLMAEQFCQGTVYAGPALTTADMLDSALANFDAAITKGTANGSAAATTLVNVARVGRARALLQDGQAAAAITAANAVPAAFSYSFAFGDDLTNRTRVSNRMWQFTFDRGSISVAPTFRVADTRVAYLAPGTHTLAAQDANAGPFYVQQKYPGYTSALRVASKLEADYIAAEAGGTATQATMIATRRTAAGQPVYAGPTDASSILTEFLRQKHLDFWLEGQRMGDFRRHPANVTGVPVTGAAYFKPGFAPIGNQTCYPLPSSETDNNPNFRP